MELKYKNRLFILLVVLTNTFGNLFLAIGLAKQPHFSFAELPAYMLAFLSNGWIDGGIALLATWMLAQLSMYTWADLTYVLPVTTSSYIVTAFLGRFVLHEPVSLARWAGIFVISFGVLLVAETPLRTAVEMEEGGRP